VLYLYFVPFIGFQIKYDDDGGGSGSIYVPNMEFAPYASCLEWKPNGKPFLMQCMIMLQHDNRLLSVSHFIMIIR